jgi:hypothetical protein
MPSARVELTPHMLQYEAKFDDRGDMRWLPYLMYFHPAGHRSEVVNTDRIGFRYSHGPDGASAGPAEAAGIGPVRLTAGSSTVFGIGASNDASTLASRLWSEHAPGLPWLNFGARSFNSAQELLLFVLYRHLLPEIRDIVLFSGFNDLGLARLPEEVRGDHGAFFNCADFFTRMDPGPAGPRFGVGRRAGRGGGSAASAGPPRSVPALAEQIEIAADLTLRHLAVWKQLADAAGARLTFVLQPLAGWVRPEPAEQERRLFAELDRIADFTGVYGDICVPEAGAAYAEALAGGCARADIGFLDFAPQLAQALAPHDWAFVDRIHFTDFGHDLAARLLADALKL